MLLFLAHSGFVVDDGKRCYVFDYYKDPNNIVWQLAKRGRELWFFVSPPHGDHFNPSITEFDGPQTRLYLPSRCTIRRGQGEEMYYPAPWPRCHA